MFWIFPLFVIPFLSVAFGTLAAYMSEERPAPTIGYLLVGLELSFMVFQLLGGWPDGPGRL